MGTCPQTTNDAVATGIDCDNPVSVKVCNAADIVVGTVDVDTTALEALITTTNTTVSGIKTILESSCPGGIPVTICNAAVATDVDLTNVESTLSNIFNILNGDCGGQVIPVEICNSIAATVDNTAMEGLLTDIKGLLTVSCPGSGFPVEICNTGDISIDTTALETINQGISDTLTAGIDVTVSNPTDLSILEATNASLLTILTALSNKFPGKHYAGVTCYNIHPSGIGEAVRFAIFDAAGVFSSYEFYDSTSGAAVDVGDVVDCPVPGCCTDVFPNIEEWAPDTCIAADAGFDVTSLDDALTNGCWPRSYRITLEVDGFELVTERLVSFTYDQAQSVVSAASNSPEAITGLSAYFVAALNAITNPYLQWDIIADGGGGYFFQLLFNTNQAIQLTIKRLHSCLAADVVDAQYVFTNTPGGSYQWTDSGDVRNFQVDVWDGNTCAGNI